MLLTIHLKFDPLVMSAMMVLHIPLDRRDVIESLRLLKAAEMAFSTAQLISTMGGMEQARNAMPDAVTWMALLGPCRKHKNVSVAKHAFNKILNIGDQLGFKPAAFVILADVCKSSGRFDLAKRIHAKRLALGLHKVRQLYTFHVNTQAT